VEILDKATKTEFKIVGGQLRFKPETLENAIRKASTVFSAAIDMFGPFIKLG
jgi:hypothetical protein